MVRLRKFVRGGPLSPSMSRVLQQEVADACSDVVQELAEEFVPDTLCEAYRGLLAEDLRPSFDHTVLKKTGGRFPYGLRGGAGAALAMEMGGVAQSLRELGRKTVARSKSQIARDLRASRTRRTKKTSSSACTRPGRSTSTPCTRRRKTWTPAASWNTGCRRSGTPYWRSGTSTPSWISPWVRPRPRTSCPWRRPPRKA